MSDSSSYSAAVARALRRPTEAIADERDMDFTQDELSRLSPSFLAAQAALRLPGVDDGDFVLRHAPAPQLIDALAGGLAPVRVIQRGQTVFRVYAPAHDPDPKATEAIVRDMLGVAQRVLKHAGRTFEATPLTVTAFLARNPKVRRPGTLAASAKSINSASAPDPGHVLIFRSEEAAKVLAHEMMHALELDRFSLNARLRRALADVIDVDGPYQPYEGLAEVRAQIVYSEFVSDERGIEFGEVLRRQVEHGARRCAKILAWNGNAEAVARATGKLHVRQTTYATEYFLYRTAVMAAALEDPDVIRAVKFGSDDDVFRMATRVIRTAFADDAPFRHVLAEALKRIDLDDPSLTMQAF
jgi:hypothetical protein